MKNMVWVSNFSSGCWVGSWQYNRQTKLKTGKLILSKKRKRKKKIIKVDVTKASLTHAMKKGFFLLHFLSCLSWQTVAPTLGAYYFGSFKCQPESSTGWFSYKIWIKNSTNPMVNFFKNFRPFQNYNFKIQWKINLFASSKSLPQLLKKKIRIEIWTF